MLRICKTPILGYDGSGDGKLGINDNYKATMGYNEGTNTIDVKIEKLVRPELTRSEEVDITYEVVAERSFKDTDFLKPTDNMMWVVEFDVQTETIKDPFNLLEWTKKFAAYDEVAHLNVYRYLGERYSTELLPLFVLEDFYKQTTGFETASLTYHVCDSTVISPTTWTRHGVIPMTTVEELSYQDCIAFAASRRTNIFFDVLNSDGTVNTDVEVIPVISNRQDFIVKENTGNVAAFKVIGNHYLVNLPKADRYNIRVNYINMLRDKKIQSRFDVRCINGVSSKDRLYSGIKPNQETIDYSYLGADVQSFVNSNLYGFDFSKFNGYDTLNITNSLDVGDQIMLKIDCGDQTSYAQLVINLV